MIDADGVVRAAGGVVCRTGTNGDREVLLVHRPRYDDWTFPKGKRDHGETDKQAALREVEEETRLRCSLVRELAGSEYRDRKGRPKRVRYWQMRVEGGEFAPTDEVDAVEWLSEDAAFDRLTYEHDRDVLASVATYSRTMAIAVRHPLEPLTYEDLEQFPEDGLRYELIDGELLVTAAPNRAHQRAVLNVAVILRGRLPSDLEVLVAPFDWVVNERTVLEPDILVFRRDEATERNLPRPPVLAVEVLSPTTRYRDLGVKKRAFEDAGLAHYWVVDPDEPSVTAFALRGGRFDEVGSASGGESLAVTEPLAVTLVPSDLVR